jgi:hypothetical protein
MSQLPSYISFVFILTTLLTVLLFSMAAEKPKTSLIILILWLIIQAMISLTGFYTITNNNPPRFALLILPPIIFIIALFITAKGKQFIDELNIRILTVLHIVRIPVEIVLLLLSFHKAIPQIMTFEGKNFDILAGISAPFIFYFGFYKKQISRAVMLFWNFLCIGLLINIVSIAILSAPFPFQKIAFDQPNIAILYFPYIWLPCCIVPLVLFSHLATIRQLLNKTT